VAKNPNTPQAVLKQLIEDREPSVKYAALSNEALKDIDFMPYFPLGWLNDGDVQRNNERKALIANPNIPTGLLKSAVLNKPREFGYSVVANKNTPPYLLNALYNYAKGRGGMDKFMQDVAKMPQNKVLTEAIGNVGQKNEQGRVNDWRNVLKSEIRKSFEKNIFNPKEIADILKETAPNEKGVLNLLTLADFGEGGEFFEDGDESEISEDDTYSGEFFDESSISNEILTTSPKSDGVYGSSLANTIAQTADRIINAAMTEAVPIVEVIAGGAGRATVNIPKDSLFASNILEDVSKTATKGSDYRKTPFYVNSCKEIRSLYSLY
jgi:hypothetical protein